MSEELFDVVDQNNLVIGQEFRSVVHQRGLWHRGTSIFLFTSDGKLLVQKRNKNKDKFPSALDSSVGEHVKAGEDYAHAAARGLLEELGITDIELRPLLEYSSENGNNDNEISQLFEGFVNPNAVRFDPIEIERVEYYTLNELYGMVQTRQVSFTRWFERLVPWYLDKPTDLRVRKIFNPKSHVWRLTT
jgi:isopentenyl-diphosphate delta-isomerase